MPEQQPSGDRACRYCHKPFDTRGWYKLARMTPAGTEFHSIPLCSIICVIRWSYDFATRQGARGVMALREQARNPEMWKAAIGGIIDQFTKGKGT